MSSEQHEPQGRCFRCEGRGWIYNGEPEDGMMSGRDTCPVCRGNCWVYLSTLENEIERMRAIWLGKA